jgi:hypothetical protein
VEIERCLNCACDTWQGKFWKTHSGWVEKNGCLEGEDTAGVNKVRFVTL